MSENYEITEKEIKYTNTTFQQELRLSGIVIKKDDRLVIHNPIYETIFDQNWLEQQNKT